MDVQTSSSKPLHQIGGGESEVVLELEATQPQVANVRSSASTGSSAERLTYSWKDITVWSGPPPTTATSSNGGAGEAVRMNINQAARSKWARCCNRGKGPSKQLLKNVSGIVRPGELMAIMGASGAGKTTLLNALNFRSSSDLFVSGDRYLNGVRVGPSCLSSLSAYVQQEDLFFGSLTVKEHLTFQSRVRMKASTPSQVRKKRVEEVLREFGLTTAQNTRIGHPGRIKGISGGEMKRLSFASEVLTDPHIFFCDEPTSGLDSYMAENIVATLRTLASKGKTIICTIHQPSSQVYSMFDRLLLLAQGRVAFLGNATDTLPFFAENGFQCPPNFNPADFFIQALAIQPGKEDESRDKVDRICDRFTESPLGLEVKKSLESLVPERETEELVKKTAKLTGKGKKVSPYKNSWIHQFRAVFWRSWLSYTKDPYVLRLRVAQTFFMSLIIGVVFYGQKINQDGVQNINGAIFMMIAMQTIQNIFAVVDSFCLEIPIFLREHFNGMYRADVYFLAKMLAELPLYIFLPVSFVSINYFMVGLNPDVECFLKFMGVIILLANIGISMGYLMSCLTKSISLALAMAPVGILPFMLFGGFIMNADSIPKYLVWLKYTSFFYYGTEALDIIQWDNIKEIHCNRDNFSCPRTGAVVLKLFAYEPKHLNRDVLVLAAEIVVIRFLAYLVLLIKTRRSER